MRMRLSEKLILMHSVRRVQGTNRGRKISLARRVHPVLRNNLNLRVNIKNGLVSWQTSTHKNQRLPAKNGTPPILF
jgi:DNA-binding protein